MANDEWLRQALAQREHEGTLRVLQTNNPALVDFSSNDYLGLANNTRLSEQAQLLLLERGNGVGSTGSRLIRGNSAWAEELEAQLATFHQAEAGLLFSSGYSANLALLSAIPTRHDTILYDELCHASLHDGLRLSLARSFSIRHNDSEHLRTRLRSATGRVFVMAESIYSMDGDACPLREWASLCNEAGAFMLLDEAHAGGVLGPKGEGLGVQEGLPNAILARVITFGKAWGSHGAVVLGSSLLREYLLNFARPFVYTTALPPHSLAAIESALQLMPQLSEERSHVRQLAQALQRELLGESVRGGEAAVLSFIQPGNDAIAALAQYLQYYGFDVRAIRSPTVPRGTERLRICVHSFNTPEQTRQLIQLLNSRISPLNASTPIAR
jgi:8-amino-7-oxononanoate synthase